MTDHAAGRSRRDAILLGAGAALAYLAVLAITRHVFAADAPDYARSVAAWTLGTDCGFVEFGHTLWRPLGVLLLGSQESAATFEIRTASSARVLLLAASALGLLAMVAVVAWVRAVTRSWGGAALAGALLLGSRAFVNFSQIGTSYVPALACLSAALWASPRAERDGWWRPVLSGVLCGASVLFWAPFVFAVPGVLLAPLFLDPRGWRAWREVIAGGLAFGFVLGGTYLGIALALDWSSLADFRAWVAKASYGGEQAAGLSRSVIGFARAFVELGDLGREVKRLLLGDPFAGGADNPLLSGQFVRFAAFYAFVAFVLVLLVRRPEGRRRLLFMAVAAAPVVGFSLVWHGGDMERWLAIVPLVALGVGTAWAISPERWARGVLAAATIVLCVANVLEMSNASRDRATSLVTSRLEGIPASTERPALVVVSHWNDALMQVQRNYPETPRLSAGIRITDAVTPSSAWVPQWREIVTRSIMEAWQAGHPVYVSARLREPTPDPAWGWVEGDDPRISWKDLAGFFSPLEYSDGRPNAADGFLPLPDSEGNRRRLAEWVRDVPQEELMQGACRVRR